MEPPLLPPGRYPFAEDEYDLSELAFIEAPVDLDAFFKAQRDTDGQPLARDVPVVLRCQSDSYEAVFMVWWPHGSERIYMLAPKNHVVGRA